VCRKLLVVLCPERYRTGCQCSIIGQLCSIWEWSHSRRLEG